MQKTKFYTLAVIGGLVVTTLVVSGLASASVGNNASLDGRGEMRGQFKEHQGEMKTIMENNDYDSWSVQMTERADGLCQHAEEIRDNINQETFNLLQQAHQLRIAGDFDGAKQLLDDSGLDFGFGGPMMGGGKGFHRGDRVKQSQ